MHPYGRGDARLACEAISSAGTRPTALDALQEGAFARALVKAMGSSQAVKQPGATMLAVDDIGIDFL